MPKYIPNRIQATVQSYGPDGLVIQGFEGSNWKKVRGDAYQFAVGHTLRGQRWTIQYARLVDGVYRPFRVSRGKVAFEQTRWKLYLVDTLSNEEDHYECPDGKHGVYKTLRAAREALVRYYELIPKGKTAHARKLRY